VVRLTWIISGALGGVAGVFTGLTPQLHPEIGFNLLLSLFAAAILGGTGSLVGAVTGGFLVGLAENLSVLVISPGYKGAMAVPAAPRNLDNAAQGISASGTKFRCSPTSSSFRVAIVPDLGVLTLGLNLQWGFTGCSTRASWGSTLSAPTRTRSSPAAPQPQLRRQFRLPWLVGVLAAMAATALASWLIASSRFACAATTSPSPRSASPSRSSWSPSTGSRSPAARRGSRAIGKPLAQLFETPFGFNSGFWG